MQNTELDPKLSETLAAASRAGLKLVIGNKNYSSWSMRPWVAMVAFNIPFEEIRIGLRQSNTVEHIAEYSSSGKIPVLVAGEITVWDSLAICEYLAEQFPERGLWPENVKARAQARSICAEMHSGFQGLRSDMYMNIKARFPGKGRTDAAQADIARICEIWEECLTAAGPHDFLFGDFSIADAYFAPVVSRFKTYSVPLAPALAAYVERVWSHPAVARWVKEALAETEALPFFDSYPE